MGLFENIKMAIEGVRANKLRSFLTALGIIIGSVPAQMSQLSFVRPSVLILTCEVMWSALVISMGFAKNIHTVSTATSGRLGQILTTARCTLCAFSSDC